MTTAFELPVLSTLPDGNAKGRGGFAMTRLISCLWVLLLIGCTKAPLQRTQTLNPEYQVELLFEIDGCKIYRFSDSYQRYFTNCNGSVQWNESCGKNCHRNVEVPTSRKDAP